MLKVTKVIPRKELKIHVTFSDGVSGEIDIKPFIKGGISDELKDKEFFKTVKLDQFSGITWDNGFDFCPKVLMQLVQDDLKKIA